MVVVFVVVVVNVVVFSAAASDIRGCGCGRGCCCVCCLLAVVAGGGEQHFRRAWSGACRLVSVFGFCMIGMPLLCAQLINLPQAA